MENELKLNIDYYINEDGLYVFTKEYHLKKGFCCGKGCLHCPYNYENVPEDKMSILKKNNIA